MHTHLTNIRRNPEIVALKMIQTFVHHLTGHDVLSGLKTRSTTHFGRANWSEIFEDLVAKHPQSTVGVFFCGSNTFEREIQELCLRQSINNHQVRFDFHSEKF